jgi:hypothetical protein
MKQFLDKALSSSVDLLPSVLESANLLPDFWPSLKTKLYSEPDVVSKSPVACQLLASVLEHESVIDLSPFNLSLEGLDQILLKSTLDSLATLSLSGNLFIDETTLRTILATYPHLKNLHLLNTPQLQFGTKMSLARTAKVELLDVSQFVIASCISE